MQIKMWNYSQYKTDNYGSSRAVQIGPLILYFSEEIVVAFAWKGERVVCMNVWGYMQGRHLAQIDGGTKEAKGKRVNPVMFEEQLEGILVGLLSGGEEDEG